MRILFVASELAPHTPGGAGTVVARLADRLAAEHDVTVALIGAGGGDLPGARFSTLSVPSGPSMFDRSAAAAGYLASSERFDMVEFQDFDALGYDTLVDRAASGTDRSSVLVRLHGPADLMFEAVGLLPDDLVEIMAREREAFRMADAVLASSPSMAALAVDRYDLEPSRTLVAPLPVAHASARPRRPSRTPEVVCFGRLAEVKGSHDFLRSVIPVLRARPDLVVRFIGEDGWSVEAGMPMRRWLEQMVPSDLSDRVVFEGRLTGERLEQALESAWIGVVPSRFEGYCLAADELRAAGLPIVVRDLAGLRDRYSEDTGALVTAGDLGDAVATLLDDASLLAELTHAPPPVAGDPMQPYAALPSPRHPRSQAGLATAAVKRVEAARASTRRGLMSGLTGRLAGGVLRLVPASIARIAVRVLPRGLKDRFRAVASWPAEVERRRREERIRSVENSIAAGRFPPLTNPDVTVVIPCFNQGEFVEAALCSVFEQSHESWEVVVVDDGSDDAATVALLDRLAWPRVQLLRQENRGLSAARNRGVYAASGRFVVPLDADDELEPEFLELMLAALESNPEAAFAHCWARLFGDIEAVWIGRPYNRYQMLLENSVIGCVLLRKDAWAQVGGYDESMRSGNEDWELWIRLMASGWGQVTVPRPLFRYRKHGISMSVDTEARFEAGREEVRRRHPDLYSEDSLRNTRRRHHPCVSILGRTGGSGADFVQPFEFVAGEDLAAMVRAANGRYVIDGRAGVDFDAIEVAVGELDSRPERAGADCGVATLWRRWALLDPAAPLDRSGLPVDDLVALGLDDWAVPPAVLEAGVPVQRQTPDWLACSEATP